MPPNKRPAYLRRVDLSQFEAQERDPHLALDALQIQVKSFKRAARRCAYLKGDDRKLADDQLADESAALDLALKRLERAMGGAR
jgi:hypothetical protein